MVGYMLAAALLPLVLAGHHQMTNEQMMYMMQMQNGMQNGMMNGNMMNAGQYQVDFNGMMQVGQQMNQMNQMNQGSHGNQNQANAWWNMESAEDMEAYQKWCEERRMAMEEQEAQKKMLEEMQEMAEEKKRKAAREAAAHEAQAKRDSMKQQVKMWQSQLAAAEMYSGNMDKYEKMKARYAFMITLDFLKLCRCSDYTAHLSRYLVYDDLHYEGAPAAETWSLDELDGVDLTNVDAVAQRMATLSEGDQLKLYFHGLISGVCDGVKVYVDQVKQWEAQYNFMGF